MSDTYTRTHYHVTQFTPGCLSDCDDGPYFSVTEARQMAREFVAFNREHGDKVKGNARDGYTINGNYRVVVEPCNLRECLDYRG